MLEQPGRTQIRSENFTAKRPGIAGWQPTLCSRAANQHPPGILQRFPNSIPVQLAQVAQLAAAVEGETIPTIVVGDFNANPGTPTYNIMLQAEFIDVPAALGLTGPTCCQAEDLNNTTSLLKNRFDYIFGRDIESVLAGVIINNTPFEDVRPRWASDHAGVVATVTIEGEATAVVEPSSAGIMASAMFLSVLWYGARRKA
jgi:hypothetical protein